MNYSGTKGKKLITYQRKRFCSPWRFPVSVQDTFKNTSKKTVSHPTHHYRSPPTWFNGRQGYRSASLLATHLIQDVEQTDRPLQIISLDIEKACDQISPAIIIQVLQAFGVPEVLILGLQNYVCIRYTKVEVNG
jgi:hypothetical protein